jgi:hypothetical protein
MIYSLLDGWAASARVFAIRTFFSIFPKTERHDAFLCCQSIFRVCCCFNSADLLPLPTGAPPGPQIEVHDYMPPD